MEEEKLNPYYLAYCRAHGKTPEEMMRQDSETYPGGKMCGFIVWNMRMRAKFFGSHPELGGVKRMNDETVEAYTRWLEQRVEDGKSDQV